MHEEASSAVYVVGIHHDSAYSARDLDTERVGSKAIGLLSLPSEWTPPFFCIEDGAQPNEASLLSAASFAGIDPQDPLYVRSSGTREGIQERGALCSEEAHLGSVVEVLKRLRSTPSMVEARRAQKIHFIVQKRVRTQAKGHLSNERRVAQKTRDWVAEVESGPRHAAESGAVAVRRWRALEEQAAPLACLLRANIYRVLRQVAAWAGKQRLHLEWVWDGERIWIVQCESAEALTGSIPSELVKNSSHSALDLTKLRCFREATAADFAKFKKLKNARIYKELGYDMPPFFVLSDPAVIESIFRRNEVPEDLQHDLDILCEAPLVLRTDGVKIPEEKRQMLPRSDELRSAQDAASWLIDKFSKNIGGFDPLTAGVVLIGHHFLPAVSSAWCLAYPDRRRVRIEALWGIPEGLYYFPHDVFDVDVATVTHGKEANDSVRIVGRRIRFKEKFIAPDTDGSWIIHPIGAPHDWNASIGRQAWVKNIAHTSRRIAQAAQQPVVVMWFIGLAGKRDYDGVLPWYHEPWTTVQETSVSSALSRTSKPGETLTIKTSSDLDRLVDTDGPRPGVSRIEVEPEESGIVRDKAFIDRLSKVAKDRGYVVELRGGLLSHVYYTLKRDGVDVVCVDAFATEDETIEFNKLVRDEIPAKIEAQGEAAEVARLEGEALLAALKNKLVEEALEVFDAKSSDSIGEEIADVLEVLYALEKMLGLKRSEVDAVREAKLKKRGGFGKGVMLLKTRLSTPTSGELVALGDSAIVIRDESQLPAHDPGVNVDKRSQGGESERLLTFSIPVQAKEFRVGRHSFDLATPLGQSHPMRVEVTFQRDGAEKRVRFRLMNSALQLELFSPQSDVGDAEEI